MDQAQHKRNKKDNQQSQPNSKQNLNETVTRTGANLIIFRLFSFLRFLN
jgi:hypothetical protein